MYVSSDYSKISVIPDVGSADVTITVETEFTAKKVDIIGTSPSGDVYNFDMAQVNRHKWTMKVQFIEIGVFSIEIIAYAEDGTEVRETISIEGVPFDFGF